MEDEHIEPIKIEENDTAVYLGRTGPFVIQISVTSPYMVLCEPKGEISLYDVHLGSVGYIRNCRLGVWSIAVEWSNTKGHTCLQATHEAVQDISVEDWRFAGLINIQKDSRYLALLNKQLNPTINASVVGASSTRGYVNGLFFVECGYLQGAFPYEVLEDGRETIGIRVTMDVELAWQSFESLGSYWSKDE